MNSPSIIYAIDFDGTLCTNEWPKIGKPNEQLIKWLKHEKEKGATLILWTMREGELLREAVEWCKNIGLYFDAINDNAPEQQKLYKNNPRKVYADRYIDDHNFMFFGSSVGSITIEAEDIADLCTKGHLHLGYAEKETIKNATFSDV